MIPEKHMFTITTWPELRAAIETHPARKILGSHADRLEEFDDQPLSELCQIVLVERTDTLTDLETKMGRALHPPLWEYVERTDGWYEFVLIISDDGFGYVLLVEDRPDGNQALLDYCRALASYVLFVSQEARGSELTRMCERHGAGAGF